MKNFIIHTYTTSMNIKFGFDPQPLHKVWTPFRIRGEKKSENISDLKRNVKSRSDTLTDMIGARDFAEEIALIVCLHVCLGAP